MLFTGKNYLIWLNNCKMGTANRKDTSAFVSLPIFSAALLSPQGNMSAGCSYQTSCSAMLQPFVPLDPTPCVQQQPVTPDANRRLIFIAQLGLDPDLCPKERPHPNPASFPGRFYWRSQSVPLWNGSSSPHRCLRKEYFSFRAHPTVQLSFLFSFWMQLPPWRAVQNE